MFYVLLSHFKLSYGKPGIKGKFFIVILGTNRQCMIRMKAINSAFVTSVVYQESPDSELLLRRVFFSKAAQDFRIHNMAFGSKVSISGRDNTENRNQGKESLLNIEGGKFSHFGRTVAIHKNWLEVRLDQKNSGSIT